MSEDPAGPRKRSDGNVMFTHVVTTTPSDEKDTVRMRGAKEVLGLYLDDGGSREEDDIFVRMMLQGIVMVGIILFSIRRFDVA
ncbi:hypothetical protein VP1G_11367 [Cytospora mali]|uniref:Uncharacterized protein n=1 Tax=Cytospora mali TaxID=578113 RepID=A0A194VDR0_CYTMA|nr:hypothetical protein VP1G_11367 [Valsa mali var. pyri (nom. inval.)]